MRLRAASTETAVPLAAPPRPDRSISHNCCCWALLPMTVPWLKWKTVLTLAAVRTGLENRKVTSSPSVSWYVTVVGLTRVAGSSRPSSGSTARRTGRRGRGRRDIGYLSGVRGIAARFGPFNRVHRTRSGQPDRQPRFFFPARRPRAGRGCGPGYNQPPPRSLARRTAPMSAADPVTLWIAQLKDG